MAAGQPALRSVDSKLMSRVIEPRKALTAGAAAFRIVSAVSGRRNRLGVSGPAGVKEQGAAALGFIQEPGRPRRFHDPIPDGDTGLTSPGSERGARSRFGERKQNARHGTAKRRKRSAAG